MQQLSDQHLEVFKPEKQTDTPREQWNSKNVLEKHYRKNAAGVKENSNKIIFAEIYIFFQPIKTLCNPSKLSILQTFVRFQPFKHEFQPFEAFFPISKHGMIFIPYAGSQRQHTSNRHIWELRLATFPLSGGKQMTLTIEFRYTKPNHQN